MPEDVRSFPHITFNSVKSKPEIRFIALTGKGVQWLWTLRFANKDESVYLIPALTEPCLVLSPKSENAPDPIAVKPSENLHLSMHHSGETTVTAGTQSKLYRQREGSGPALGRILSLAINRLDNFPIIQVEQFNADGEREKYAVIPVPGLFPSLPVRVSLYRERSDVDDWDMPHAPRSTVILLRFDVKLAERPIRYHVLVWQDSTLPLFDGDIAIHVDP